MSILDTRKFVKRFYVKHECLANLFVFKYEHLFMVVFWQGIGFTGVDGILLEAFCCRK
jgi:hypothetical protein